MTRKSPIRQDNVQRVVKACLAAGLPVSTVTVSPEGEIVVYTAGSDSAPTINPLDRLLGNDP